MSKIPLVLFMSFVSRGVLGDVIYSLAPAFVGKAAQHEVNNVSQALRYLNSTTRPRAVLVLDNAVTLPAYRDVLLRLVQYARSGGTVIFCGRFSCDSLYDDITLMFKSAWGLPWTPCAYTNMDVAVNASMKLLDKNHLVKTYCSKATYLGNVGENASVYIETPPEVDEDEDDEEFPREPWKRPDRTTMAFTSIGKGRVGYVGHVYVDETVTNAILAMCFWPGSRDPLVPGTGVPPVSGSPTYTAEHTSYAVPAEKDDGTDGPLRKILIVSLEKEPWLDEIYQQFHNAIRKRASVTEVLNRRTAIQALSGNTRPDAVIVSDAAIINAKHRELLTHLVTYTRAGGTILLGMQFSNHLVPNKASAFFGHWGLTTWSMGSYHRTTFALNSTGVPAPLDLRTLQPSYSMKAVHIKGAARQHAVYLPTAESHVESHVFPASPIVGAQGEESPILFAPVGEGHLGYVGDVNGEQGTVRVMLEMVGVKISPGDMGSRTHSTGITISYGQITGQQTETNPEIPLPHPAPRRTERPREAEVKARADEYAKMQQRKEAQAEKLKNEGNEFFRTEKWAQAADKYRDAALLDGPKPIYMSNLAAALLKLEQWDSAHSAASRALMYDAKHIKALYRRALARKEQMRYDAALADIELLLVLGPSNTLARIEQKALRRLKSSVKGRNVHNWPGDELLGNSSSRHVEDAIDVEVDSDSEDASHKGNGTPCKFYNSTGCRNGKRCKFSHASDSKSVRDELGRNVCLYWLIGECRFGCRCVYAHEKTYLPARGWWTDDKRLARLRKEFNEAVARDPLPESLRAPEFILAEALKPASWRSDLWVVAEHEIRKAAEDEAYAAAAEEEFDEYDDSEEYSDEDRLEQEIEERGQNWGFTLDEVNEMLSYGIKPWDPDAEEELMAIHAAMDHY